MRRWRGTWWGWLAVAVVVAGGGASAEEEPLLDASEGRSPQGPSLRVERVELSTRPLPAVRLQVSAPAEPVTRTLGAAGGAPERIYVDVPGAVLGPRVQKLLTGTGAIRRVRLAQFGKETVRVVVDLARPVPFSVGSAGRTVTIALGQNPQDPQAPPARATPPTRPPARTGKGKARPERAVPPAVTAPLATPVDPPALASTVGGEVLASPPPRLVEEPLPADVSVARKSTPAPVSREGATEVASPGSPAPPTTAVTEETPGPPAPAAPGAPPPAGPAPVIATVGGVPFVWPVLEAPAYAAADAAVLRQRVATWQGGAVPDESVPHAAVSPAARYLAADLAFLGAARRNGDYFAAITAYGAALRDAPEFPDAERAQFMLGQLHLALTLGPEAGADFGLFARRFPASPLMPYVRLGEASALRLRRRPEEARRLLGQVIAGAEGDLLCRARFEEALQARSAQAAAQVAEAYGQLAAGCPELMATPGMLADYGEALLAAGDRDRLRALLAARREGRPKAEEARLHLLAGMLFAEADNGYRARLEFEQAAALHPGSAAAAEARVRTALLGAGGDPDRLAAALAGLAGEAASTALRAALLGEAAEASARAGRFEAALAFLARAAETGPEGRAQADGRRAELLGRWIASLRGQDDAAGLTTVYAAYATDVKELATLEDRLAVAEALGHLGLHAAAAGLLAAPAQRVPLAAVALAEETLAGGDADGARAVLRRLPAGVLSAALAARRARIAARAALRAGDAEAATAEAATVDDAGLRAEVAAAVLGLPGGPPRARALLAPVLAGPAPSTRVLLIAGAAAAADGDWAPAAEAYARALTTAADGPERIEASAGLVRTARARGDGPQALAALDRLNGSGDALLRRAAAAVGRAVVRAPAEGGDDGH